MRLNSNYRLAAIAGFIATMLPSLGTVVPLNQANYVIVVNSVLRDPTWENQLIALKEAQGLKVGILNVPDANFSNLSASYSQKNIRDQLMTAYTSGGKILKYVLLVGDGNALAAKMMYLNEIGAPSESKNYASSKYLNFIPGPSCQGATLDFYDPNNIIWAEPNSTTGSYIIPDAVTNENGNIVNDDFYGNFEGNLTLPFVYDSNIDPLSQPYIVPEAMVGRIPVRNKGEMRNYVNKLSDYANHLTTTSAGMLSLQKNVLGLIDDRDNAYTPVDQVQRPFVNDYPQLMPPGSTLRKVYNTGTPNLFNRNGEQNLLTIYGSGVGARGELSPFMRYREKYEPTPSYLDHNRSGNAATSDDDIDDYPAVLGGAYTILLPTICDKIDFDAVDRTDRKKIGALVLKTATYSDGYFSNGNDLMEDVLLAPGKGPIAIIGVRWNSFLEENIEYTKRFLNATFGGESVLGQIARSAKLYSMAKFPSRQSRNSPAEHLGDMVVLGDPAMVVNIPNAGANVANPTTLTVKSDKGRINATWSAVTGASGYAVSIGNFPGIPYWTYFATGTNMILSQTYPGGRLQHGETYTITVRPFVTISGSPRSFARTSGKSASVVLDAKVSPPASISAVATASKNVNIIITKSLDSDIKQHNIYRQAAGGGNKILLTTLTMPTLTYTDTKAVLLRDYEYLATETDNTNNESTPILSGVVHTGPSAGSGFLISNSAGNMLEVDSTGNIYLRQNFSTGLLSGLVIRNVSTNTGVALTPDGTLKCTSMSTNNSAFLQVPANLIGGLVLKNASNKPIMHIGTNGKMTLPKDLFPNSF